MNIEQEIKIILNKNQYKKLLGIANSTLVSANYQTNYYFDANELNLAKSRITLRIRKTDENFKITAKILDKKESTNIKTVCKEYNKKINNIEFDEIIKDNKKLISIYPKLKDIITTPIEDIKMIGSLITYRIKFRPLKDFPFAELDKSEYLGIEEYELEWELSSDNEFKKVYKWLEDIDIKPNNNGINSKYGRFIELYGK